jgi:hypothetical protein
MISRGWARYLWKEMYRSWEAAGSFRPTDACVQNLEDSIFQEWSQEQRHGSLTETRDIQSFQEDFFLSLCLLFILNIPAFSDK